MIEVKNLTFSYGKDKQALHGLDFTVEDGEIFGFLGPNGSGKSTTQKILTGILKGHGGRVSLFGQDPSAVRGPEFFRKIGVLFEFPYLYANLSAVENLEYFASFYPGEQRRGVLGVSRATKFPLEMNATRSHSRSASTMLWVVTKTVVPFLRSCPRSRPWRICSSSTQGGGCPDGKKLLRPVQKGLPDAGVGEIFLDGTWLSGPLYGLCEPGLYPLHADAALQRVSV